MNGAAQVVERPRLGSVCSGVGGMAEAKRRAGAARWVKHPWQPPAPREVIHDLYWNRRMTKQEVAAHLGLTIKVIETAMVKLAIPRRKAMKRSQGGASNSAWKGNAAGYKAMHARVERARGKPKRCEVCGTTRGGVVYDWANLSGDYNNPQDYQRMCRFCHRKYDHARAGR